MTPSHEKNAGSSMRKPVAFESAAERLAFEVHRNEDRLGRDRDAGRLQQIALPLLGGGMIDLEDAQIRIRIAAGEGIETGAQNHVLSGGRGCPALNGFRELILGVAATNRHEGADGRGGRFHPIGSQSGRLFGPENAERQGVVENQRTIVNLMRRAAQGYAEGGAAGLGFLHDAP